MRGLGWVRPVEDEDVEEEEEEDDDEETGEGLSGSREKAEEDGEV